MTKAWIFGKHNIGDDIIKGKVEKSLDMPSEYVGERVDLSRIKPEDGNIIIVINRNIFTMDLDKVMGYIKQDLTAPFVTLKKIRTFGGITLGKDMDIERIFTNKVFIFSGIFYFPKSYFKATMSEIFRSMDKKDLRIFMPHNRRY